MLEKVRQFIFGEDNRTKLENRLMMERNDAKIECRRLEIDNYQLKKAIGDDAGNRFDLAQGCKLVIFRDGNNEFRWHLKARNHKIIACSGEGYKKIQGLEKSLNLVGKIIEVVEVVNETK